MIIEASIRDLKIKGRTFRNAGRTIGIIFKNNGEGLPISVKCSDIETFLKRFGDHSNITLNINGEKLNTSILKVERDAVLHHPHNIEFKEL
ncbi:MAG: hypothetical protein RR891_10960 [Clostridium sp.]|uniref:hypothetical protein n=1 Tax=Clostridium sp. TaxID=1506 RepID=UPI003060E092